MATPDAIARSKRSELFSKQEEIYDHYFMLHSYSYLDDFLRKQLKDNSDNSDKSVVIQITTHAPLLQHRDLHLLQKSLGFSREQITLLRLQQFGTEIDFCARIRYDYCLKDYCYLCQSCL